MSEFHYPHTATETRELIERYADEIVVVRRKRNGTMQTLFRCEQAHEHHDMFQACVCQAKAAAEAEIEDEGDGRCDICRTALPNHSDTCLDARPISITSYNLQ